MEKTIFEALEKFKKYDPRKDLEENVVKPLREKFLQEDRKKLSEKQQLHKEEVEKQREKLWGLKKELLVLAGVIFGSSLALAINQQPNSVFITGTGLLLGAILIGLFIMHTEIESQRWFSDMLQKGDLELYLRMNKEAIFKEEKEIVGVQIELLKERLSHKGCAENFLRITRIKIDWLHKIFYVGFLLALFIIWASLFVN